MARHGITRFRGLCSGFLDSRQTGPTHGMDVSVDVAGSLCTESFP